MHVNQTLDMEKSNVILFESIDTGTYLHSCVSAISRRARKSLTEFLALGLIAENHENHENHENSMKNHANTVDNHEIPCKI